MEGKESLPPKDEKKEESFGELPIPAELLKTRAQLLKVRDLMDFYFSDANLRRDEFMRNSLNDDRAIDLKVFLKFNKLKQLDVTVELIAEAVESSSKLEIFNKDSVRRVEEFDFSKDDSSAVALYPPFDRRVDRFFAKDNEDLRLQIERQFELDRDSLVYVGFARQPSNKRIRGVDMELCSVEVKTRILNFETPKWDLVTREEFFRRMDEEELESAKRKREADDDESSEKRQKEAPSEEKNESEEAPSSPKNSNAPSHFA